MARLTLMDKAAYLDFVVEIIRRSNAQKGFQVLPRRWVVERTFGWMIAGVASWAITNIASTYPTP